MSFEFRNKVILKDAKTKWGWAVKSLDDLILATMGMPVFKNVWDVIGVVINVVKDILNGKCAFDNVDAFCEYCGKMYI